MFMYAGVPWRFLLKQSSPLGQMYGAMVLPCGRYTQLVLLLGKA